MPSRTMKRGGVICVKGFPDLHGSGRGEKLVDPCVRGMRPRSSRPWRAAGCPRDRNRSSRAQRVDRQPGHARRALRGAAGGMRLVRGAGPDAAAGRARTRSRRRSAIRRTRATASTSARAWRPSARSPGGRCRAACCRPSRSSAASSFRRDTADRAGGAGPGARHRRGRTAASKAPRSASGSRARRSPRRSRARTAAFTCACAPGPGRTSCASAAPRWRPRSPTCASRSRGRPSRNFRLAPENVIRGRVVSSKGEPIRGATVHAVRNAEDPVASGEAQSADDGTFALGGLDSQALLPARVEVRLAARDAEVDGRPRPAKGVGFKLARTGVIEGRVVDSDGEGQANATVVALLSAGARRDGVADHLAGRQRRQVRAGPLPGRAPITCGPATARCWCIRPRRSRSAIRSWTRRSSCKLAHKGARVRGRVVDARGARRRARGARRAGRALAAGAAAQGGRRDRPRRQVRGRRAAARALRDLDARRRRAFCRSPSGPREVEIPIDPGATVDLPETITVRPQAERE